MLKIPKGVRSATGINIDPKISKLCDDKLKKHIEKVSLKCYKQAAKQLPIEAVMNLVKKLFAHGGSCWFNVKTPVRA
ncbi:hypothetical protein KEM48_009518 [Puccinia striiformis f. sp. tritici PST-130]|nr:hypothetical protein KEM48_009518 [Puccinia striiformis f. sp. tritici PST-130]